MNLIRRLGLFALVGALLLALFPTTSSSAARTWPTLRRGDAGENVCTLQAHLIQRGYSMGWDCDFGPTTESKVKSFQTANALTSDGIVGANTWEKLIVVARRGDNNTVVKSLQRQLNRYGNSLTADGAFGAGTETAVKSFQSSRGMLADGIVGADTWAALLSGSTGGSGGSAGDKLSDSTARTMVNNAGISVVSSGNCSNRNIGTCTSLEQVRRGSIDGVIRFKQQSGCSFSITGGTETGHSSGTYSHWNGYKIDTSRTTCVINYIKANYTFIGNRGDGAPQYRDSYGNVFADEYWLNHWDITFY